MFNLNSRMVIEQEMLLKIKNCTYAKKRYF